MKGVMRGILDPSRKVLLSSVVAILCFFTLLPHLTEQKKSDKVLEENEELGFIFSQLQGEDEPLVHVDKLSNWLMGDLDPYENPNIHPFDRDLDQFEKETAPWKRKKRWGRNGRARRRGSWGRDRKGKKSSSRTTWTLTASERDDNHDDDYNNDDNEDGGKGSGSWSSIGSEEDENGGYVSEDFISKWKKANKRKGSYRQGRNRRGSYKRGRSRRGSYRQGRNRRGSYRRGRRTFRGGRGRRGTFRRGRGRRGTFRRGRGRRGTFRKGRNRRGIYRKGRDGRRGKKDDFETNDNLDDDHPELIDAKDLGVFKLLVPKEYRYTRSRFRGKPLKGKKGLTKFVTLLLLDLYSRWRRKLKNFSKQNKTKKPSPSSPLKTTKTTTKPKASPTPTTPITPKPPTPTTKQPTPGPIKLT